MALTNKNQPGPFWLDLQFHENDQQKIVKPNEITIDTKQYPPPINNDDLSNRVQGSIFGMAIGDALGAHVEFRPRSYLEANMVKDLEGGGTWGLEKGQFTDDTSMALCLANSLIACHDFVPYDQLVRYKWWYRNGYMSSTGHCFDIGAATRQSIQEFEARQKKFAQEYDIPLDQMDSLSDPNDLQQFSVYCSKDGVAGNGALMRLAPVPLFFYRDPTKAVEYSGISGKITHGDKKAYDACRYYGALIVATLNGATKDDLMSNAFYTAHKSWFGDDTLHPDIMSIAQGSYKKKGGYSEGIRGKGYVVNALEAALWAFWNDENSFEKGVLDAVNLGDDTDTTAAIYGQLAGAYYGYKKLPEKWREAIYAKNFVLCVSNWIAYEGDIWFKKQTVSDVIEPLINSNPTTEIRKTTITSKPGYYSSSSNRFSTTSSIGHNAMAPVNRKAVDLSGRIGSYYDLHQDCLVELPCINFDFNDKPARPQTECRIEKGHRIESQNLLQFIGFDDELRLSLISNIVSPSGVASVIGYPYLIDEYTRVLYYSYTTRQESLPTNLDKVRTCIEQSTPQIKATHLITAIDMGIDLIVILRLKSSDSKAIDDTLEKIRQFLISDAKVIDNGPLDEILFTRIYSNIHHLTEQKTLVDVCNAVGQIKTNFDVHEPSNYILHSIERFYPENKKIYNIFVPLKPSIIQKIEQYLFRFLWINRMWSTTADSGKCDIFNIYLEEQLKEVKTQLSKLNEEYKNEKKRCEQFILKMRYENDSQKDIEYQLLNDHIQTISKNNIDDFIYSLTSLKEKVYFINDLKKQDIDYENANKYKIEQNDNEDTIREKLIGDKKHRRILCSNDTLNNNNFSTLQNFCSKLFEEKKSNSHLHLIYVDFTYSPYELKQMNIFSFINNTKEPNPRTSLLLTKKEISHHIPPRNDQNINILLLGKSGVGKSTLINTFKSYLKFNRYEDFRSNISAPSILVSFLHFVRMDSEEHIIRFGTVDRNEDFDHRNQSTTQQCKSYNFQTNNNEKICLIDTPGFGQDNDDIVMQHILSRIRNLTHLNVICILIQSDENQLDDYQMCLTKLFHFLGNQAINNIVFCFTKTISKDVNREQRNQSIQLMLDTLTTQNIRFNEKMIFDFDSTFFIDSTISHRFASFIGSSNQASERSWQISNKGWNRLLNYIRQNLHPLDIQQDVEKAQVARIEINQLIRPLLETVRNNIRNFLLLRILNRNDSIELCPIPIVHPSAICYSCRRPYVQCGPFWIMSDSPHEYRGTCYTCSCSSDQHIQIEYRLEYKYHINQIQQRSVCQEDLLDIIVHFAQFLLQGNQKINNDPFLLYLNQMINEERSFSSNLAPHGMNLALYNQLMNFRQNYERRLNLIKQKSVGNDLDIDDVIEKTKQIPMIKKQLDASTKMEEIPV